MTETYQYRENYWVKKESAGVVGSELMKLHQSGELTAKRVLDVAKDESSPIHPHFEWDDSEAGHKYRLIQARTMIRALVVVSESSQSESVVPQSLFVHVPTPDQKEGKYVPLSTVIENIDEYERALIEAQRGVESAERRFFELRRLAEKRGDKAEALAIAVQGFATVKEALALLRG